VPPASHHDPAVAIQFRKRMAPADRIILARHLDVGAVDIDASHPECQQSEAVRPASTAARLSRPPACENAPAIRCDPAPFTAMPRMIYTTSGWFSSAFNVRLRVVRPRPACRAPRREHTAWQSRGRSGHHRARGGKHTISSIISATAGACFPSKGWSVIMPPPLTRPEPVPAQVAALTPAGATPDPSSSPGRPSVPADKHSTPHPASCPKD